MFLGYHNSKAIIQLMGSNKVDQLNYYIFYRLWFIGKLLDQDPALITHSQRDIYRSDIQTLKISTSIFLALEKHKILHMKKLFNIFVLNTIQDMSNTEHTYSPAY